MHRVREAVWPGRQALLAQGTVAHELGDDTALVVRKYVLRRKGSCRGEVSGSSMVFGESDDVNRRRQTSDVGVVVMYSKPKRREEFRERDSA